MYLQITSKCNFTCDHCCFSHGFNRGKHGDYYIMKKAIMWYSYIDNSYVTIGGGEPTNHPRFFDLLRLCLQRFENVHMVTNGSNTPAMKRLYNILTDQDYPDLFDDMDDDEKDVAMNAYRSIYIGDRTSFCVALSQDRYHDKIDPWVKETWERQSVRSKVYPWGTRSEHSDRFRINTFNYVENIGRARTKGISETNPFNPQPNPCVCEDVFIKPDGSVRMCGCPSSPVIANIFGDYSFSEEYERAREENDGDNPCVKKLKKRKAA